MIFHICLFVVLLFIECFKDELYGLYFMIINVLMVEALIQATFGFLPLPALLLFVLCIFLMSVQK